MKTKYHNENKIDLCYPVTHVHNFDLLQFINYGSVTGKSSTAIFIINKLKFRKQQKPHKALQKLNFHSKLHEKIRSLPKRKIIKNLKTDSLILYNSINKNKF